MDQKTFDEYLKGFKDESFDLLVSKGSEYAGSIDRLANFKRGANLVGVPPETVCFIYMSKHYDAIANYVKTGIQGSEPIQGRLHDLTNYCVLLGAIIEERQSEVKRS